MTVIKQKAVCTAGHAKSLRNYINDPKALLHSFQNIRNPKRWAFEMDRTRKAFGHNTPARRGAKNTIQYHQILAFLPDECDMNGGKMTPELCIKYAEEYAQKRYPNCQIAFALHKEHCKADKTSRYAVHMAVNRSDLSTGNRIDEGLSKSAKRDRANFVRSMDGRWNLQQLEKGKPNSKIHSRQPDRVGAEREIIDRAAKRGIAPEDASYKFNLRKLCQGLKKQATSIEEYRRLLQEWGVATEIKNGKLYATDMDNDTYSFRVSRLDTALEENLLAAFFSKNAENANMIRIEAEMQTKAQELADYNAIRKEYLDIVKKRYQEYAKEAHQKKGSPLENIPTLLVPKIPETLSKDAGVRRDVLSMIRKSEELRRRVSSTSSMSGDTAKAAGTRQERMKQQAQSQDRNAQKNRDSR